MGKYDPLQEYLNKIQSSKDEIELTFDEINEILGLNLPKSAYKYRMWWANPTSPKQHPYAQAWLSAGWRVDGLDLEKKWVRFKRRYSNQREMETNRVSAVNSQNPSIGAQFQEKACEILSKHFQVEFQEEYLIEIGDPPKGHRFDLASIDLRYVGECKNYSWTTSGNVPSAKMGFMNQAVFYLSLLPKSIARFVVMRKDMHPKRSETLAEYYYRTYHHLLQGIAVLEVDLENDTVKEINMINRTE